jgi:TorA maturation chaperone TorD
MTHDEAVLQELQGAANLCRLGAQLFRHELSETLAAGLHESGVFQRLEASGYAFDSERLRDPNYVRELRGDYTRTFIGPGPHVAPYGSVHHPDDGHRGRLWGDSTVWLRTFARDHGVVFEGAGYDGIPDHLGHELELHALLLEAEMAARRVGDAGRIERLNNSQRLLLATQLTRWVPIFCRRVCAVTGGFYAELARLTRDLVDAQAERLGVPHVALSSPAHARVVGVCVGGVWLRRGSGSDPSPERDDHGRPQPVRRRDDVAAGDDNPRRRFCAPLARCTRGCGLRRQHWCGRRHLTR